MQETALESITITTPRDEASFWTTHQHERHELLSAITGTITVASDSGVRTLPRGSAVWIPAHTAHAVRALPGNTMRCTWLDARSVPRALEHITPLMPTPLLDDVLDHLDTLHDPPRRARAEAFIVDLLTVDTRAPEGLPLPTSAWLRTVTDALTADPGSAQTVNDWARRCAVSVRTFTRRFQEETGMSFSRWRLRLRIQVAMSALMSGSSIAWTARHVGYESAAAFITAFKRETSTTPRVFAHGQRSMSADVSADPGV